MATSMGRNAVGLYLRNYCCVKTQSCKTFLNTISVRYSQAALDDGKDKPNVDDGKSKPSVLSAMMAAARDRRTAFDALIQKEATAYEKGKRHLANMMGEDPETFTQKDVDDAIRYLFPSGLFEKKARPMLKHPLEYYPPQKAAQFGPDGRPYECLFYTGKANYYNLMHECANQMNKLIKYEDQKIAQGILEPNIEQVNLTRSEWIDKKALELKIVENIRDEEYERFIIMMERLLQQPYAKQAEAFILEYRKELHAILNKEVIHELQYDDNGIAFSEAVGQRKSTNARVIIRDQGSGKVTVNDKPILEYFPSIQARLSIMFPFQFVGMLGRFDTECYVAKDGGKQGQAGAVRLAVSRALQSFVDVDKIEQMRQAGLLTQDPRVRERKKPGQKKARKKFTWKKR
ncbi:28S ribosomal protein S9, mitochondrial-like [Anneissia japonica]|uniref:28S ribosomal protein S9, mitochondrial-like n=1 Tax=Anneissia japonica TaxID=1529436 RepID=UPI0014258A0B|nr:28S ribosomal protein S9, mitochondrial-like [Anneissia japonica]